MVRGYHYTDGKRVGIFTVDCESSDASGVHTERPMVQLTVRHEASQPVKEWFCIADLKEVD